IERIMRENDMLEKEEIFSKVLRAGRRTYFFDVRATKADDYYITITESKKFTEEDGSFHFKKHKIYLYKEDFSAFSEILEEMTSYVLNHKGEEVISERHQKDFKKEYVTERISVEEGIPQTSSFTDIDFDDI
ncbi:MAG TPA: PUR family DNA/RNA-binding protein, partial [Flavobacterium sp.]|nr:PUR family DNA/RNA-binding protein [Flavobacterium sp.]